MKNLAIAISCWIGIVVSAKKIHMFVTGAILHMSAKLLESGKKLRIGFLTVSILTMSSSLVAQDWWKPESTLAIVASTNGDFAKGVNQLFRLDSNQLEQLLHHNNGTIAINAKWTKTLQKSNLNGNISGRTDYEIQRTDLEDFCEFLGKRLESQPPKWWKELVLSSRVVNWEILFKNDHPRVEMAMEDRLLISPQIHVDS